MSLFQSHFLNSYLNIFVSCLLCSIFHPRPTCEKGKNSEISSYKIGRLKLSDGEQLFTCTTYILATEDCKIKEDSYTIYKEELN